MRDVSTFSTASTSLHHSPTTTRVNDNDHTSRVDDGHCDDPDDLYVTRQRSPHHTDDDDNHNAHHIDDDDTTMDVGR